VIDVAMPDIAELRVEIEAAFADRAYPGDERLALGGGCPGDESERVSRFFRGKDWREISPGAITEAEGLDRHAFVFFLSSEAFTYYLPALLRFALDPDDPLDMAETISWKLTPPDLTVAKDDPASARREAREGFVRWADSLSAAETRAVVQVLEHLAERLEEIYDSNPARLALDAFWAQRGTLVP
jgi:hypothetical protein